MLRCRHISVSIDSKPDDVYEFASDPENLPKWAAGLSGSIKRIGDDWIAESPMGSVKVKFVQKNNFGVLDHTVTLSSGRSFYNPMRVLANERGSELTFTLFRQPEMTDDDFEKDALAVDTDLRKLKSLLES